MNTKLNVKQWAIASLAVFVVMTLLALLLGKVMSPQPVEGGTLSLAQPDPMMSRALVFSARIILSGLFALIFTKGYEGKPGLGEGLRYGLWIGLLLVAPQYLIDLQYSSVPAAAQTMSMFVRLVQFIICGAVVAQLYKPGKA